MIELLVVIALIGLLAGAAGGNYVSSLKRGRDTQRKGDMKKTQQAFEQYYGANQKYDATCSNMKGSFVGSYPPTPPNGAAYTINCTASTYCACARLERDGEGNAIDNSCNYTGVGSRNFFCVSNLQ